MFFDIPGFQIPTTCNIGNIGTCSSIVLSKQGHILKLLILGREKFVLAQKFINFELKLNTKEGESNHL